MIKSLINKKNIIKYQNCYAYALNINEPKGFNIGCICGLYDPNYHSSQFKSIFIDDCKCLELDIKEVESNYELQDENEWLVALYGTDYMYIDGLNQICDFHFVKKVYGCNYWTEKTRNHKRRYLDDNYKLITNPKTSEFYIRDYYGNIIPYEYITTFCLKKQKN